MSTIDETLAISGLRVEEGEHHGPARHTAVVLRIFQDMDIVALEPVQARALATLLHKFAAKYDE